MFEVFKDECGEVRLKSNAVMKVWLGISIPVFFLCDFLFPWRSENQKKKLSNLFSSGNSSLTQVKLKQIKCNSMRLEIRTERRGYWEYI